MRTYFLKEYRKTQIAPSGSSGIYQPKWDLFDAISFIKDTMNIYPTQSSEVLIAEPQLYSSGAGNNLSSVENLEGNSRSLVKLEPTILFSASLLDLSPTPSISVTPSSPSPEPPVTPWTTPCQPKAKKKKIADPVTDQCLEAVKVLTDVLTKKTEDDFCVL
ncbi:uncharacterized protein LOC122264270 [Penaeus japonicus]|uniref:uncharacterized protein LOC122264270 n=1 Tax=Penaeus japonicus TaxID=27405 RepID=UPI001C713D27|nr:uncharacterized protein LOC122264270 [Penaeus japonicus]